MSSHCLSTSLGDVEDVAEGPTAVAAATAVSALRRSLATMLTYRRSESIRSFSSTGLALRYSSDGRRATAADRGSAALMSDR